ncbi:acidPPc domain-containing protein [Mycena indigotica]|uniref:AcidPPc domain-containing protein n=1 Tax=Mycena indigotica TaxID=2126181 RepID=A0A8H6S1P5_9AGAR|nr:acidPPc domain-containing protein [Mycena indigotica]KAF7290595.1 acidPPc domain-containing protein [Mycena indigotica]
MAGGFPWDILSANTLRPIIADIYRSRGVTVPHLAKAESLDLIARIEKLGIDKVFKDEEKKKKNAAEVETVSGRRSKRKHVEEEEQEQEQEVDEPRAKRGRPAVSTANNNISARTRSTRGRPEEEAEPISQQKRGRGRPRKQQQSEDEEDADEAEPEEESISTAPKRGRGRPPKTISAPSASRSRARQSLSRVSTSRKAPAQPRVSARIRAASASPKKRSASLSPRKGRRPAQPRVVGRPRAVKPRPRQRNKSAAAKTRRKLVFDGVELPKFLPAGSLNALVNGNDDDEDMPSVLQTEDEDAIGEDADLSSLQNSNKENEASLLEIATARTDEGEEVPNPMDIDMGSEPDHGDAQDRALEPTDIDSPMPQEHTVATDDQIEEARLHGSAIGIDLDAPEITIEPIAGSGVTSMPVENGQVPAPANGEASGNGLLRPTIITAREGSVELNPEYRIEVFSPTSAIDDEAPGANWVNGTASDENAAAEAIPVGGEPVPLELEVAIGGLDGIKNIVPPGDTPASLAESDTLELEIDDQRTGFDAYEFDDPMATIDALP